MKGKNMMKLKRSIDKRSNKMSGIKKKKEDEKIQN